MKTRLVVDTGPMLLYFAGNSEAKEVFSKIMSGKTEGYTCETNVAELYYKTCERLGRETAAIRQASIRNSGLSIIPLDQRLTILAGDLKCRYKSVLSLVDAFLLAAAKMLRATVVTTDSSLKDLSIVDVELIRF